MPRCSSWCEGGLMWESLERQLLPQIYPATRACTPRSENYFSSVSRRVLRQAQCPVHHDACTCVSTCQWWGALALEGLVVLMAGVWGKRPKAGSATQSLTSSGILLGAHVPVLGKFARTFPRDRVYLGGPIPLGILPHQRGPAWKPHFSYNRCWVSVQMPQTCLQRVRGALAGMQTEPKSAGRASKSPRSTPGPLNTFVFSWKLGWRQHGYQVERVRGVRPASGSLIAFPGKMHLSVLAELSHIWDSNFQLSSA